MRVSNWPETPATDHILLNSFERDLKVLAGEAHDCGFDDLPELRLKLHGIVSLCSELLAQAERKERERRDRIEAGEARREMASAVGPMDPVRF